MRVWCCRVANATTSIMVRWDGCSDDHTIYYHEYAYGLRRSSMAYFHGAQAICIIMVVETLGHFNIQCATLFTSLQKQLEYRCQSNLEFKDLIKLAYVMEYHSRFPIYTAWLSQDYNYSFRHWKCHLYSRLHKLINIIDEKVWWVWKFGSNAEMALGPAPLKSLICDT